MSGELEDDYTPKTDESRALAAQLAEQRRADEARAAEVDRAARRALADAEDDRDRRR